MNAARDIVGDGFRITFPELEMIAYWEGDDGFLFHGGWGVTPPVVAVPSQGVWDEVVPPWLRDRREVVISRLRDDAGHQVDEGGDADWQYRMNPQKRMLKRT